MASRVDNGLRPIIRRHLPQVDWLSVETGGTVSGCPDLNGCHQGAEFWVECKACAGLRPRLRPEQIGWIARRVRAGGRAWVAVRRHRPAGPRVDSRDELWLVWGGYAGQLAQGGLTSAPASLVAPGGPARWPWPAVLEHLRGPPPDSGLGPIRP